MNLSRPRRCDPCRADELVVRAALAGAIEITRTTEISVWPAAPTTRCRSHWPRTYSRWSYRPSTSVHGKTISLPPSTSSAPPPRAIANIPADCWRAGVTPPDDYWNALLEAETPHHPLGCPAGAGLVDAKLDRTVPRATSPVSRRPRRSVTAPLPESLSRSPRR